MPGGRGVRIHIGGRSAAGLAAQAVGDATALLFNAGSFLVSATCLLLIRARPALRQPARHATTIRAEISEGATFIIRDPLLRPLTIYPAAANFAYSGSTALAVVFLIRVAGFGAAAAGLVMAAIGVGGILGAMTARRVAARLGTARALLFSALATGLFALLLPLTGPGPRITFYIGSLVVGAGMTAGNIIVTSFRQAYCPPPMLGRVTATQRFLVFGTIPLGALTAGGLGTVLGVRNALWVMLALYALSGTVLLNHSIRASKNLPDTTATFAQTPL
jgi:predicted MFS family arabinose efflux permease